MLTREILRDPRKWEDSREKERPRPRLLLLGPSVQSRTSIGPGASRESGSLESLAGSEKSAKRNHARSEGEEKERRTDRPLAEQKFHLIDGLDLDRLTVRKGGVGSKKSRL